MTNRKIADIVKDKKFLVLPEHQTVQEACRCMWEWHSGAVLVLDNQQRLAGIFTGRDAVRALAEGRKAEETTLAQAMTADPVTISPQNHVIDALHEMSNHGSSSSRGKRQDLRPRLAKRFPGDGDRPTGRRNSSFGMLPLRE
jgi:CBS domain-containing protein